MSKKLLAISCAALAVLAIICVLFVKGTVTFPAFETIGSDKETLSAVSSIAQLEDGCYYVWHNDAQTDIQTDLNGTVSDNIFRLCPQGIINWKKNEQISHTIWFSSADDVEIPTLYPGDKLLFVSSTQVPYDGIGWERFADYGYSIGVANMEGDRSGHYRIIFNADDGYAGYVNPESDAVELEQFVNVTEIFLDKIGDVNVRDGLVSDGGTVLGLHKDEIYVCEWYTGTYYQDFEMMADMHVFCSMESFQTYDYEFLHSNCIAVTIPSWLKSGYYYIDNAGLFRYVSETDQYIYTGKAFDPNIDWNAPIILYDEQGFVTYDPTSEVTEHTNDDPDIKEDDFSDADTSDAGMERYENDTDGELIAP